MKTLFKIVYTGTERHDELPEWAKRANLPYKVLEEYGETTYEISNTHTDFFEDENEFNEFVDFKKEEEDDIFSSVQIKYVGKAYFDDDFIKACEEAHRKCKNSGAFSFAYRKNIKDELRRQFIMNKTFANKFIKQDYLAYIRSL